MSTIFSSYILPGAISLLGVAGAWALHKLASYLQAKEAHLRFGAFLVMLVNTAADAVVLVSTQLKTEVGKESTKAILADAAKTVIAQLKTKAPDLIGALGISDADLAVLATHAVSVQAANVANAVTTIASVVTPPKPAA